MPGTVGNERSIVRLKRILAYHDRENKWLKVYFDKVRFLDGKTGHYNRIFEGTTGRGVVVVPEDAKGRIGMVRVYRYPVGEWQWELPRGYSEKELTGQENAERELKEETGLAARRLQKVGEVFPNTGVLSTLIEVFAARELRGSLGELPLSEAISDFRFFTHRDLSRMVRQGELRDGVTLAALLLCSQAHHTGPSSDRVRMREAARTLKRNRTLSSRLKNTTHESRPAP